MNYLDKIKISLQKKYGSPQYFFQFWAGSGKVNIPHLKESFLKCLGYYRGLFEDYSDHLKETTHSETPFIEMVYSGSLVKEIEDFLENHSVEIIEKCGFSPFIFVYMYSLETEEFCIIQMNNHVYLDGASGNIFFRDVCLAYNSGRGDYSDFLSKSIKDKNLIQQFISQSSFYENIKYHFYKRQMISKGKKTKNKSSIKKLYSCDADLDRKVNYTSVFFPLEAKERSRNTLLLASIAKGLLDFKNGVLSDNVVLGIPLNIRGKKELIGNYAVPFHISVKKGQVTDLCAYIEKCMKTVKDPVKRLATYALYSESVANATLEDVFRTFCSFSSRMHCYVTNIQDYLYTDRAEFLSGTQLEYTGLFAYPLQANIGALFSIAYCRDFVGVTLACSPKFMSKEESREFLDHLRASFC